MSILPLCVCVVSAPCDRESRDTWEPGCVCVFWGVGVGKGAGEKGESMGGWASVTPNM